VTDIEVGVATLIGEDSVERTVVNRVRPRITSQNLEASAQVTLELQLQRIIVRSESILEKTDEAEVRIE